MFGLLNTFVTTILDKFAVDSKTQFSLVQTDHFSIIVGVSFMFINMFGDIIARNELLILKSADYILLTQCIWLQCIVNVCTTYIYVTSSAKKINSLACNTLTMLINLP